MAPVWERAVHSVYRACLSYLLSIYVFSYFPFGFEGRIWDLTVSVPDHYLSFYFGSSDHVLKLTELIFKNIVTENSQEIPDWK